RVQLPHVDLFPYTTLFRSEWPMRCGLWTGPVAFVWLPPERQKYSQCVLPTISPPASRMRLATVASKSGMKPSSVEAPFIIGTPADRKSTRLNSSHLGSSYA